MQFSPVLYYFATLISSTLFADSQSVFLLSVSSDQIKENEVGGTCNMYGKGEESVHGFGGKARRKETTRKIEVWMGGWDKNGSY
jgi:hypothetical protein